MLSQPKKGNAMRAGQDGWLIGDKEVKALKKVGKIKGAKRTRQLFETVDPDQQCESTIGEAGHPDNMHCYICQFFLENFDDAGLVKVKGKQTYGRTGRQCEHVVPALLMAILMGLFFQDMIG